MTDKKTTGQKKSTPKRAAKPMGNNGRRHNGEKSKTMELPRRVAVGHGILENIGEICRSLHLRGTAIIVVDKTTKRIAGNRVVKLLEAENYDTHQVVITEADLENLENPNNLLKKLVFVKRSATGT